MDKNKFLSFDIENKVKYLNEQLDNGLTVTRIRDDLHLGEKELQRIIKNGGYKYNQKLKNYIRVTEVVNYQNSEVVVGYKSSDIVVNNDEYQNLINSIKQIQSMSSKLEEVYQWYELQNNIIEKEQLRIETNTSDTVTRSFKVYEDVYAEFTKLCKTYNTYKVQDLISQALKEFCNKYK